MEGLTFICEPYIWRTLSNSLTFIYNSPNRIGQIIFENNKLLDPQIEDIWAMLHMCDRIVNCILCIIYVSCEINCLNICIIVLVCKGSDVRYTMSDVNVFCLVNVISREFLLFQSPLLWLATLVLGHNVFYMSLHFMSSVPCNWFGDKSIVEL